MKRLTRQSAFGDTPERFEQRLSQMLQQEERPMKKKSIGALVLAVVLVLALAATALAVARQIGLLDFVQHHDAERGEDAAGMILREIEQEGGEMERAVVTVREASYDGYQVHFVLAVQPKEEGVALMEEMDRDIPMLKAEALAHGDDLLYVRCDMTAREETAFAGTSLGWEREGASMIYGYTAALTGERAPEALTFEVDCSLLAEDEYVQPVETARLTFTLPRSAEAHTVDLPLDVDVKVAHLTRLVLSRTPLEMSLTVYYEPVLEKYPYFGVLDGTGYEMAFGGGAMFYDEKAASYRSTATWAAGEVMPDVLLLWVQEADVVAEIDLRTGEAQVYPATVESTPEEQIIHFEREA